MLLTLLLAACQTTPGRKGSPRSTHLDRAEQAWRTLQSVAPGTAAARQALATYNQAVAAVLKTLRTTEGTAGWGREMSIPGARPWRLTFEPSTARLHTAARTFALAPFAHCWIAADVKPRGFDRLVARPGIGVPVVLAQDDPLRATRPYHPAKGDFLPATAVLEFPTPATSQPATVRLRFYDPLSVTHLPAGSATLPLAENLTAALQYSLTDSTHDENGTKRLTPSASGEDESRLFFLHRYDRTKVPIVFVHGLRSGPVVWKNAINELLADPELRRRYQPVGFVYPTGLPIPTSAARLRQLLQASRNKLDPQHAHPGFKGIVLVGHSMGGLLARMQVVDSGSVFWRSFFAATPQKIASEVDPSTQKLVRSAMMFNRLPNVKTVVFITTPHLGSEIADIGIVRLVANLILVLPRTARKQFKAITDLPPADIHPALRSFNEWGNTGVENLSTQHPYFRALALLPLSVPYHSVIGVRNAIDPTSGTDGVVPYWSAHLKGAASETVVPYPHGCVERSGTVSAVLKILKETP